MFTKLYDTISQSCPQTFITITFIGGWQFLLAAIVIGLMYFDSKRMIVPTVSRYALTLSHPAARLYGQTSRDMRRLG
jgi:hypothetical protein